MTKSAATVLAGLLLGLTLTVFGQGAGPLKFLRAIPLPELHDGDFDHFAVDVSGNKLYAAAEENSKLEVIDLSANKLVKTISDLKAPHSMVCRPDLKKLFVVDSDLGEIRIYDTDSNQAIGSIKLREGADSSGYDPSTKYLYVVNCGKAAHLPNAFISIVDTSTSKMLSEIKLDSDDVEGMVFDSPGTRMLVAIRGNSTIEVFDREKHTLLETWPVPDTKGLTAISLDTAGRRLFLGVRNPSKFVVLDADSGKLVASIPAVSMVDDMAFDSAQKRIYYAGNAFLDVFQQRDADHYDRLAHVPTALRAKTGILIAELNLYCLGVPHHEKQSAELRLFKVLP